MIITSCLGLLSRGVGFYGLVGNTILRLICRFGIEGLWFMFVLGIMNCVC